MSKIDFNTIVDAEPAHVPNKPRCWKVVCTTEDGATHDYPYRFGTKHAATREAVRIVETAMQARERQEALCGQ